MTLNECRGQLDPKVSGSISDDELKLVRDELQTLAEVFVDFALSEQPTTPESIGTLSE